jgi:3-mercaptopyruvate sulfurtransferase SseA
MRHLLAAMAVLALSGVASAQYKTPPQGTPAIPVTANPNVQITPANPAEQSIDSARRITREEAIKMVSAKKAIYVDVRPKDQYDIEHITGAISIPLGELAARMNELPKNKFIVTYCA